MSIGFTKIRLRYCVRATRCTGMYTTCYHNTYDEDRAGAISRNEKHSFFRRTVKKTQKITRVINHGPLVYTAI